MAGEITTIARPYAEAVFARAKEADAIEAWSQALALLSAVASDPQMAAQIANPNVPRERIRDMILEVCGDALPAEAANLVRLLAQNARLGAIPEITELFEASRIADQGVRHVLVRSAYPVSPDQQAELAALAEPLHVERLVAVVLLRLRLHLLANQVPHHVPEQAVLLGGVEQIERGEIGRGIEHGGFLPRTRRRSAGFTAKI